MISVFYLLFSIVYDLLRLWYLPILFNYLNHMLEIIGKY